MRDATRQYARGLFGESLFGRAKTESLWAMIKAYFDESGTGSSSPVLVVAGLASSPKKWMELTKAWKEALDTSPRGFKTLTHFHMVDAAQFQGEFKGWPQNERDALVKRLVKIIRKTVQWRTWTAICMDDYRAIYRGKGAKLGFTFCAFGCVSRLADLSRAAFGGSRVNHAFEGGGEGSGRTFQSFKTLLRKKLAGPYKIGSLSVCEKKKCLPLQAADLHAYEVRKFLREAIRMTGRPLRKSFDRLLLELDER